jgi:hypothetical protein
MTTTRQPAATRPPVPAIVPLTGWVSRHSVTILRVSVGLVFLAFAIPKLIPGASPLEGLVARTVEALSLGLVSGQVGVLLVGVLEILIAASLISGRLVGLGLLAMCGAMAGFFAPLVLFPGELFGGGITLEAQYILKDVVLLAAAAVIATRSRA